MANKKIIFWGAALLAIGILGWLLFVVLSVLTLGKFRDAANIFGYIGLLSLPASVVVWLIRRIFKVK